MKECCRPGWGSNPQRPDHQSDAHPTEPPRPALINMKISYINKKMSSIVTIFTLISREIFMLSGEPGERRMYRLTANPFIYYTLFIRLKPPNIFAINRSKATFVL